jgi:hypothetical protein
VLERRVLRIIFRTKMGEEVTEVWIGRKSEGIPRRRLEDDIKKAVKNI